MEPSDKRPRLEEWIRLSDSFQRAEMKIICPIMKAENSIRVLYRLQQEKLTEAIENAGKSHGLIFENIQYVSQATSRGAESNLFIKFRNPLPNDENLCSRFKESLERNLTRTMVKDILVERVQDASQTIPQPLVSEYDFEMHKMKLCLAELDGEKEESPRRLDLSIEGENIKSYMDDLSNSYIKFAMLSQNGRGKSYVLNLLMLMTADNEEEYSANNRNLIVPNDFPDNTLVKNLTDSDLQNLPVVVNEFLNIQDKTQFNNLSLMRPICKQLQNITNAETALHGLSDIDAYFTIKKRLNLEPYFLSQKGNQGGHESTTKCVIRLRYGTLYEMKVEYFTKSELQQQLYELVTMEMEEGSSSCSAEEVNETAQECLTERFKILTGHSFSKDMKDKFNGPTDITFLPEVLEFVGKTELYFGQGKNPTHDRLALQNILKGLTIPQDSVDANDDIYKKRISAVKEIVVYLPCKILYGGKEILEMPGTDDSDPIAMDFIANALNEVDALILLTENGLKLCEKEVKTMFSKSHFIRNFKKQPDKHTVMLLTYPEKNTNWQYASGDEERIKLLEKEGNKKRNAELKAMVKILKLDTLPKSLEERICTSYILPVLHTSILAQEHKPEYEVISRHEDTFLKYTGIQELIMNLDELVFSRQKSNFEEIKRELFHFHKEINGVIKVEDARSIVQTLSVRISRDPIESGLRSRFEILERKLFQKIEDAIFGDVSRMMRKELAELVPKAIDRWDQIEPEVNSIGVFSPYFCGKNPRYHICLYHVLFEGLENSKILIIKKILHTVQDLLQNLKRGAIEQYTDELNTILHDKGRPKTVTIDFVEGAVGDQLEDALKWYQGKKQRPFNEKTLEKFMDDSQKKSLKDAILTPNFKKCTMEEAKIKTRENITKCIMDVEENFISRVNRLHLQRFKSLSSKLWNRNGPPKIWKQLIMHLRSLPGEEHNYRGNINILKMIKASFI